MFQSATPFAIRDENDGQQGPLGTKSSKPVLGVSSHAGQQPQKRGGLVDSTPLKGGLLSGAQTIGAKSTRKALGDLSSSQVNIRGLATPQQQKGIGGGGDGGGGVTTSKKMNVPGLVGGQGSSIVGSSIKPATMFASMVEAAAISIPSYDVHDPADMVCSYVGKDEDAYDYVMRKAAAIKFTLSPPAVDENWNGSNSCWQELPLNCGAELNSSLDELSMPDISCEVPE